MILPIDIAVEFRLLERRLYGTGRSILLWPSEGSVQS